MTSTTTFFYDDPRILVADVTDIVPTTTGPLVDQLNATARLVILATLILSLVTQRAYPLLFGVLVLVAIVVYYKQFATAKRETVAPCLEPTPGNPFRNPTVFSKSDLPPPCEGADIDKKVDEILYKSNFVDLNNLHMREFSAVKFHTVPRQDRGAFIDFLAGDLPNCKKDQADCVVPPPYSLQEGGV